MKTINLFTTKKKNKKIIFSDVLSSIILITSLILNFFLFQSYQSFSKFLNLESTELDLIINTPSVEQINLIKNYDNVNFAVPFYFFNASVFLNNESSETDLYVIESLEEINSTFFSEKLNILTDNEIDKESNIIAIDSELSSKLGLRLGEEIELSFANVKEYFKISRIYQTDGRHNYSGSIILPMSKEINNLLTEYYKGVKLYKGAFVGLKDNNYSRFDNFIGEAYLEPRQENQSLDDYNNYRDQFRLENRGRNVFFVDAYLENSRNLYSTEINRSFLIFISMTIFLLLTRVFFALQNILKNLKNIKADLNDMYSKKDIRNNILNINLTNNFYSLLTFTLFIILSLSLYSLFGVLTYRYYATFFIYFITPFIISEIFIWVVIIYKLNKSLWKIIIMKFLLI